jgi:hypothetical protein
VNDAGEVPGRVAKFARHVVCLVAMLVDIFKPHSQLKESVCAQLTLSQPS